MKGGQKVIIEPHRHEGVFIARSKEDALVTLNSTPGKDVYGEKRIQVCKGVGLLVDGFMGGVLGYMGCGPPVRTDPCIHCAAAGLCVLTFFPVPPPALSRPQVDGPPGPDGVATKVEYRVWNPFRSKLAAAILGGAFLFSFPWFD